MVNNSASQPGQITGSSVSNLDDPFFEKREISPRLSRYIEFATGTGVRAGRGDPPIQGGFNAINEDYYSEVSILSSEQRLGWREVMSESVSAKQCWTMWSRFNPTACCVVGENLDGTTERDFDNMRKQNQEDVCVEEGETRETVKKLAEEASAPEAVRLAKNKISSRRKIRLRNTTRVKCS